MAKDDYVYFSKENAGRMIGELPWVMRRAGANQEFQYLRSPVPGEGEDLQCVALNIDKLTGSCIKKYFPSASTHFRDDPRFVDIIINAQDVLDNNGIIYENVQDIPKRARAK